MKKTWIHKKYRKSEFVGIYKNNKKAIRFFVLEDKSGKIQSQVFNSPQAAKAQGWKVK